MEPQSNIHLNSDLAEKLKKKWQELQLFPHLKPTVVIGFDGFTDEILKAVDRRLDDKTFHPLKTIEEFGQRIVAAAGKSCNIELVLSQKKLGGNAPILTDALLVGGHRINFIGAIGKNEIEPLFQAMASKCDHTYPICPSAHTDAIEFKDGKVILGKLSPLVEITYENILKKVGKESLIHHLDQADLLVYANWTMIPAMTTIWKEFLKELVPHFKVKKRRYLFVDLADPAKRTDQDLREALSILELCQGTYHVILGLNEAEAIRVAQVLGIPSKEAPLLAQAIRQKLTYYQVVIHLTQYAVSATEEEVFSVDGPFIEKPVLTTGGGDNFNAGFCNALLYGLTQKECLLSAVFTSGYYVCYGLSPSISELAQFLRNHFVRS
jgi:hypothetical protein